MRQTGELIVNVKSIEEELLCSDALVKNKIEPYYSLSCLKKFGYDIENCQFCSRYSTKCRDIFIDGGYVAII